MAFHTYVTTGNRQIAQNKNQPDTQIVQCFQTASLVPNIQKEPYHGKLHQRTALKCLFFPRVYFPLPINIRVIVTHLKYCAVWIESLFKNICQLFLYLHCYFGNSLYAA